MKKLNKYTKQNQNMYCKNTSQKIAVVTIRTFTCDSPSDQQLPCIHSAPNQSAMRYTLLIQHNFRVWPHGDRRLYRLGIKVDNGGMDERYAMNKTIASRLNDPCSVIAALQ